VNQVEAGQLFSMQSPSNRGFLLGWNEAMGDLSYADTVVENLKSLTKEELQAAARAHVLAREERQRNPDSAKHASGGGSMSTRVTAAPRVQRVTLANGLRVLLQSDATDPVVSLSLVFEGGSTLDPRDGKDWPGSWPTRWSGGLAGFRSSISRARSSDWDPISRRRRARSSPRCTRHFWRVMRPPASSTIADLLHDPGLREEDLEVVRALARTDLQARQEDLDDLAEDLFLEAIALDHPYGKLPHGRRRGIDAVTPHDLRAGYELAFRPDRGHLAIVGDFDEQAILPLLERRFGRCPMGKMHPHPFRRLLPRKSRAASCGDSWRRGR
jgi:predicted Zn-dependent peptidase